MHKRMVLVLFAAAALHAADKPAAAAIIGETLKPESPVLTEEQVTGDPSPAIIVIHPTHLRIMKWLGKPRAVWESQVVLNFARQQIIVRTRQGFETSIGILFTSHK